MNRTFFFIFAICLGLMVGLSAGIGSFVGETSSPQNTEAKPSSLPNLIKITERIYCGGEPGDERAFRELAALGIETVVSVDGARPDIEAARRHGLRYVHIPVGYDSIPEQAGLSLARLVRDRDGPVYIHCHHGRHRGPAAAAIACLADGSVQPEAALAILKNAGTSRDYRGLWKSVQDYQIPSSQTALPELVEVAQTGSLAAAMSRIDRAHEHLKACFDAGWKTPGNHPDLSAHQQALLLKEALRESARNLSDNFDAAFAARMTQAEERAEAIEKALIAGDSQTANRELQNLNQSCKECHQKYRNP